MADIVLNRGTDYVRAYSTLSFTDAGQTKLGIGTGIGNLLYIQSTAPVVTPGTPYLWIDTTGGNFNFWVEDGVT